MAVCNLSFMLLELLKKCICADYFLIKVFDMMNVSQSSNILIGLHRDHGCTRKSMYRQWGVHHDFCDFDASYPIRSVSIDCKVGFNAFLVESCLGFIGARGEMTLSTRVPTRRKVRRTPLPHLSHRSKTVVLVIRNREYIA
ncbi:hypothetical protein BDQ17DRAFT_1351534 [Cyathus striatus]|nr:hypothetical protein BDQ17DRAFT_1351534 [Cyathus striatus]